ncbi:aspartate/glutamate racemase family protein [Vibrio rotiferianus]|uniref:hypothetical protein n=1 Tax=Vibrio rotiferianus TaxID=190895 RepID=UPI002894EB3C|nr:hypothetical protein THOG10_40217 [Vibrio rotiferianus]CAH1589414.1 hypothetical protein THOB06_40216 [Vibrio rotiferianus]
MKHFDSSLREEGVSTKNNIGLAKQNNSGCHHYFTLTDKQLREFTLEDLEQKGIKTLGLIGSNSFMEGVASHNHIVEMYNVKLVIPEMHDRLKLDDVIFREAHQSKLRSISKDMCLKIINKLINQGADAIVISNCELKECVETDRVDVMCLYLDNIESKHV